MYSFANIKVFNATGLQKEGSPNKTALDAPIDIKDLLSRHGAQDEMFDDGTGEVLMWKVTGE